MSDDYPDSWGFKPEREEIPTIAERPITSLHSGLQAEPQEAAAQYPSEWAR